MGTKLVLADFPKVLKLQEWLEGSGLTWSSVVDDEELISRLSGQQVLGKRNGLKILALQVAL